MQADRVREVVRKVRSGRRAETTEAGRVAPACCDTTLYNACCEPDAKAECPPRFIHFMNFDIEHFMNFDIERARFQPRSRTVSACRNILDER
jgi:hypothetical protein